MRPLALEEIVPLESYGPARQGFRSAVIAHKEVRRMAVGPSVTLVFEDRETLRFQVQEMLWVERIDEPSRVQHELDVYNELMPGERELSATLFVEITDPGRIRAELDRLVGIDEHVALVLGRGDAQQVIRARFDAKQFEEDRISAVQYIRFSLDDAQADALADPRRYAAIRISHPVYAHEVALPQEVRASLAAGLREEPPSLLPPLPGATAGAPAQSEVVFENAGARVIRPAQPEVRGHLVVEARAPLTASGELDSKTWNAVSEALKRTASDATLRHGGCRVVADFAPGAPLRWHVLPRAH